MKGYRTLILNMLLAVAPVLQTTGAVDLGLTGQSAVVYGLLITILNAGMRLVTTTPVGTK